MENQLPFARLHADLLLLQNYVFDVVSQLLKDLLFTFVFVVQADVSIKWPVVSDQSLFAHLLSELLLMGFDVLYDQWFRLNIAFHYPKGNIRVVGVYG